MFYTLIQKIELELYMNKEDTNNQIYKKMLALNLGFQGLFFFIVASYFLKINSIYLVVCGLVSFVVMLSVFENDINISFTESNCL